MISPFNYRSLANSVSGTLSSYPNTDIIFHLLLKLRPETSRAILLTTGLHITLMYFIAAVYNAFISSVIPSGTLSRADHQPVGAITFDSIAINFLGKKSWRATAVFTD